MPVDTEKIVLDIHEYAILTHLILAPGSKGRVYNRRDWYVYNLCRFGLCELDGRYIRATPDASRKLTWDVEINYRGDKTVELLKLGVLKMSHNVTYALNRNLAYDLWKAGKLP